MWVAPRLTPLDVQRKKFSPAMRGYGIPEVDTFLDELSEQLMWLQQVIGAARMYPQAAWELPERLRQVLKVIRNTSFPRAARGYAIPDVDGFLDEVAYELQGFLQQVDMATTNSTRALPRPDGSSNRPVGVTVQDISRKEFTRVLGGYAAGEVDAFLDHMVDAFTAELKLHNDLRAAVSHARTGHFNSPAVYEVLNAAPPTALTPHDIDSHEFIKAVRGYAMHEVDSFMDELTAAFSTIQRETMQMRQELYQLRPQW